MLNEIPAKSTLRQPRAIVKVDGDILQGWQSWHVDNNTFYQADTFSVTFALSMMPAKYDAVWWAARTEITVDIYAGFPSDPDNYSISDLDVMIVGNADDVTYDPVTNTVEVSGRDFTSKLIDAQTTEKWQNQTASEIATLIAKRRGLTPVVTKTTTKSGTFYQIDHARLNSQTSEWDLLTWLAHEEQFLVYVKGRELHFEPKPSAKVEPYVLQYEKPSDERGYSVFNGKSIQFSRNLTLAKTVIVEVRAWNQNDKKGFTVKRQATHNKNTVLKGASQPIGDAQVFSYVRPNASREEAIQFAESKLREITAHEMRLNATLPADNILTTTSVIKVLGTGTAFDQVYYPDSIQREMSFTGGYTMSVSAKNHSPESVTTI